MLCFLSQTFNVLNPFATNDKTYIVKLQLRSFSDAEVLVSIPFFKNVIIS